MAEVLELRESSDCLSAPPTLRARLADDGYLFFRGLLDPTVVRRTRDEILTVLGELGWTARGTDPTEALPDTLVRREDVDDPNWWPAYARLQRCAAFHRLAHDRAIAEVIAALADLGADDVLVHPRKICRVTYPSSNWPTPPHQDFPLIQGTSDTFTAWVPLGDCTPEMGALRVLEGSHVAGYRVPVARQGVAGIGVEVDEDGDGWRSTSYRPGDVLVFLSMTVHFAPPNRGDRLRLSADYRYQSIYEPVVDASLRPHSFPLVPDWDELTSGWTDSDRAYVEYPSGRIDVQSMQVPDAALDVPTSRYVVTAEV